MKKQYTEVCELCENLFTDEEDARSIQDTGRCVDCYEKDKRNHEIRTNKYLGDKQVYNIKDFLEFWKAFGFISAMKEVRKETKYYWFKNK